MKRRLPWRRIIAAVVAIGLFWTSFEFYRTHRTLDRELRSAPTAEPVSMEVDFSKPGEYATEFVQTYDNAHGQSFYLEMTPRNTEIHGTAEPSSGSPTQFENLRATLTVTGSGGRMILKRHIEGDPSSSTIEHVPILHPEYGGWTPPPEVFRIAYTWPPPKGRYTLRIHIEQGAPGLNNMRQRVFSTYELCGLEKLRATVALILLYIALALAVVIAVVIAVLSIRRAHRTEADGD